LVVCGQIGELAFMSVCEKRRRKFPCFILENELTSPENLKIHIKFSKKKKKKRAYEIKGRKENNFRINSSDNAYLIITTC
jgi:hypothetical protein